MALADNFVCFSDARITEPITAAIYQSAANIYSEASVAGHTTRAAFANKVTTGQQNLAPLINSAIAFASLNASSTDASVSNAVAALWSMWAGV